MCDEVWTDGCFNSNKECHVSASHSHWLWSGLTLSDVTRFGCSRSRWLADGSLNNPGQQLCSLCYCLFWTKCPPILTSELSAALEARTWAGGLWGRQQVKGHRWTTVSRQPIKEVLRYCSCREVSSVCCWVWLRYIKVYVCFYQS